MATNVDMMFKEFCSINMDVWYKIISVACDIMELHKVGIVIKNNTYNDDNVMCASFWFEMFGGFFWCQNPWYMGGERVLMDFRTPSLLH